ncbi:hypothetical protein [Salinibius halmophilus]|uniref:hypothetical protein n=1 Tax=Salinibius halmophilus TaxID=1853216 RepID=UPI000E6672A2|nr:hypothetical protein [Salinibius halmophilus]
METQLGLLAAGLILLSAMIGLIPPCRQLLVKFAPQMNATSVVPAVVCMSLALFGINWPSWLLNTLFGVGAVLFLVTVGSALATLENANRKASNQ